MTPLHTYPHTPSSSEEPQQQPCKNSTTHTLPKLSSRHRQHHRPSFLNQLTSTSFLTLLLPLLLLLFAPQLTDSQVANVYQPIAYAASAVLADGNFYLYGGVITFASDNVGTNQFLRLNLTEDFDTAAAPWMRLPANLTFTMVQAAPSKDGRHFVIGGNRGNPGPLSRIYSIESQNWTAAPDLPGLPSPVGYKRTNVGMALDKVTGLVYIFGGFQQMSFSKELAVLDTSSPDANKMSWTLATNDTSMVALYEPFVHFLPTRNKTLVFGGCDEYNASTTLVGRCFPLTSGHLLSNGQTMTQLSLETLALNNAPLPRYQSCSVVLPNGNVFIQGGKDKVKGNVNDNFFAEAWILNVASWTWKKVIIDGPQMEMARAGHTCQMGVYGQIVVVGGYFMKDSNYNHVTPYMAVIDTATWKWKTSYTGGPLNCIWPSPCLPPGGYNDDDGGNSNSSDDSSGLSAGAKGGIGAGVALAILAAGVAGFIFWKRRRSSSSSLRPHAQNPDSSSFKTTGGHEALEKNEAGFSKATNAPRGPAYVATSQPTVQAVYTPPPPPHAIVEAPEPASPTMTTLPLYPGYNSGSNVSMASPAVSKKRSLFGLGGSNTNGVSDGGSSNAGGAGSDAALAAALLQAEDEVSSSSRNPGNRKGTFSDQKDPIPFQQMPVNHVRIPSAKMNQWKPQLDSYGSSSTSSSTSLQNYRPPTIHAPVNKSINPSVATSRYPAGPQSLVPEEEAKIERFSPGVPVRTVTVQDLNQDGHYPPLTPTRGYGSSSILIGSSVPETPTALVMSPLHHSTMMAYPDIIAMGSQPLPGHPAAIEGGTRASAYFGQPANINTSGIAISNSDSSNDNNGDGNGSLQTPSYRNLQMRKDLNDIAREIEIQTLQEPPKGPHALVHPSHRP